MKQLDYHDLLWRSIYKGGVEYCLKKQKELGIKDEEFFSQITNAYTNFIDCFYKELHHEKYIGSNEKNIFTNKLLKYPELRNFATNLVIGDFLNESKLDSFRLIMYSIKSHFENLGVYISTHIDDPKEPNKQPAEIKSLDDIWEKKSATRYIKGNIIKAGIEKRIWNENMEILTKRTSIYSTGKNLLSSLYHALKHEGAIPDSVTYQEAGEIFCSEFKIKQKENSKNVREPYKAFEKSNNESAFNSFVKLVKNSNYKDKY